MKKSLPTFRYHPDPVSSGVFAVSDVACGCCGAVRGYIYTGPVYATSPLRDRVCPWCIADGAAAARYGASFASGHDLATAGVPRWIVDEVVLRTPSYLSWQDPQWLSHCKDACAFLGEAQATDVARATEATKRAWMEEYGQSERNWLEVTTGYRPGCNSALYKFACLDCGVVLFAWDLS